ncbi:right-handed parallel beta-helix repeat-containing protein [Lihuaxuella thermophila]|uniref:Right handed beta helix region n=1 Tax=Lihuaxuella thermophila TaxID=1173111 RepID=A0A1H8FVS1_9BACL|nr:right-handed parallel beta-helix repeat-containing protein [Lihuaxuella thermophila]SEN35739.1 Right handed beta helix region [Lihuaxuella thermophila]
MSKIRVSRKLFARYRSIQAAISDAPAGSVIEIEPGIYKEDVWIDRYIELIGAGPKEEIIIQGVKQPTIEMGADYAVVKNVTLQQAKRNQSPVVLAGRGSLVLDGCDVFAGSGPGVSVIGNSAEPVFRRCRFFSGKNVAVLNRSRGKVLFEDCHLSSDSDIAVIFIADGNPVVRRSTITGNPGYGIFVDEHGEGTFEECNVFGFNYSPAVGIDGGNPYFYRCRIHDGGESGIVIHRGKGVFQECTLFGFEKELPAVRVCNRSQPRFQYCTIKNCKGGAFLFENEGSGLVENCDLFGFIHAPAIIIRTEAHPQILRTRIHDGNREAVVSTDHGKGLMESCELYGFNGNIVSVTHSGKMDVLRCKVYNGNEHGIYMAQKAEGIIQDTEISRFPRKAAVHIRQAADPSFVHCRIHDSRLGVEIIENGRGTFEQCLFRGLEKVWEIHESHPAIRNCKDEHEQGLELPDKPYEFMLSKPLSDLFRELDDVIGQQQVKEALREAVLYLDYLQDRKRMGFKTNEPLNIHALFTGPSDSGQLQIADIYGRVMREMGFLAKGHVVVAGVSDLIDPDPAQTERNIRSFARQAQGGILYLHGLHTLDTGPWPAPSAHMLFSLLEQLLEQEGSEFALIVAGPDQEMNHWLQAHSRIADQLQNRYVFTDYSPEDLAQIFASAAKEEDYTIHPAASPVLLREMRRLWNKLDTKSKAERVREYLQKVKAHHSRRCSRLPKQERTMEVLTTFLPEDLMVKEKSDVQPDDVSWLKELGDH